jgi:hypothetical protein
VFLLTVCKKDLNGLLLEDGYLKEKEGTNKI